MCLCVFTWRMPQPPRQLTICCINLNSAWQGDGQRQSPNRVRTSNASVGDSRQDSITLVVRFNISSRWLLVSCPAALARLFPIIAAIAKGDSAPVARRQTQLSACRIVQNAEFALRKRTSVGRAYHHRAYLWAQQLPGAAHTLSSANK